MALPAESMGRLVARALTGSWRLAPPPFPLDPFEIKTVAPLLLRTGAAALVWWRLRDSELRSAPWADPFHQAYRLHTLQTAIQEPRILTALSLLRASKIEPVLAKGWAVARSYPEPGLRPFGDIDLYVRQEQYLEARSTLSHSEPLPVDLHSGFFGLEKRSENHFFSRSQLVNLNGEGVYVPSIEDHLRLLSLHLLRHGLVRASWLVDIAVLLESHEGEIDWDYLLSGNRRLASYILATLALARHLLDSPVPHSFLERAGSLPGWLMPAVCRTWGLGVMRREPLATYFARPTTLLDGLRRHWPNALEATTGFSAPLNRVPRLPFQLAYVARRAVRFAARRSQTVDFRRSRAPVQA